MVVNKFAMRPHNADPVRESFSHYTHANVVNGAAAFTKPSALSPWRFIPQIETWPPPLPSVLLPPSPRTERIPWVAELLYQLLR